MADNQSTTGAGVAPIVSPPSAAGSEHGTKAQPSPQGGSSVAIVSPPSAAGSEQVGKHQPQPSTQEGAAAVIAPPPSASCSKEGGKLQPQPSPTGGAAAPTVPPPSAPGSEEVRKLQSSLQGVASVEGTTSTQPKDTAEDVAQLSLYEQLHMRSKASRSNNATSEKINLATADDDKLIALLKAKAKAAAENDEESKKLRNLTETTSYEEMMTYHLQRDPYYNSKRWKSYQNANNVYNFYINGVDVESLDVKTKPLQSFMEPYMKTMSQLAVVRDDPEQVKKLYGKLYKWEFRANYPIEDDSHREFSSHSITLFMEALGKGAVPAEHRLYLKLRKPKNVDLIDDNMTDTESDSDWGDWIYLARSNYAKGRIGVFAARQFHAGTPIGLYVGPTLWRADIEGGKDPWEAYLQDQLKDHEDYSDYQMSVRDLEGHWCVLGPKPLHRVNKCLLNEHGEDKGKTNSGDTGNKDGDIDEDKETTTPLYMGMHYLNDALFDLHKEASTKLKVRRQQELNVSASEDATLVATTRIKKGTELCFSYDLDDLTMLRYSVKAEKRKKTAKSPLSKPLKKSKQPPSKPSDRKVSAAVGRDKTDDRTKLTEEGNTEKATSPRTDRYMMRRCDNVPSQHQGQSSGERKKRPRCQAELKDHLSGGKRYYG